MSISSRDDALTRRKARIADYIRQGKTPLEICDLEGLDPANEPRRLRKEVADPLGLTISTSGTTPPPLGLMDIERLTKARLSAKLVDLRDRHHYVDVGQMLGMTNKEQLRAIKSPHYHNWTLSQIQRLAVASNMTFNEMLNEMMRPHDIDFRKKS